VKRWVHWLMPEASMSGLISYTFQQHFTALELGIDSHICFFNYKEGIATAKFPQTRLPDMKISPHSVKDGAINIIHNLASPFKLDNMVMELHGMPQWVIRSMDSLTTVCSKLESAELCLTRFPSHVPYWKELTDKPIHVIPPGLDLNFWKPEGEAIEFAYHPTVLWADSWREGVKEPWDLLYAMKMVARANPAAKLKMVNIPSYYRDILHYFIGRLKLDNVIDWPIEGQVRNVDEYYRGADVVYSPVNEDGNNTVWEARSCGIPVITLLPTAVEIAEAILRQGSKAEIKKVDQALGIDQAKAYDMKNTVKAMAGIFERAFTS
jgi:glycosyltransferase involved in cell wall biosynthesis